MGRRGRCFCGGWGTLGGERGRRYGLRCPCSLLSCVEHHELEAAAVTVGVDFGKVREADGEFARHFGRVVEAERSFEGEK